MYLWQIEYNQMNIYDGNSPLWIALNYVSLTDWIQHVIVISESVPVVNRFKLCIFDRLNTTAKDVVGTLIELWIALNYVSLTDWIQLIIIFELYFNILQQISQ